MEELTNHKPLQSKMQRDVLTGLTTVFREVFGDDKIQLTRETTAADISEWDSLTHIEMIVAVEEHFGIQFKSLDLKKFDNVGDLVDVVNAKLAA